MDLLESGSEREPFSLRAVRLPDWAVRAVAAGVALVLVAGVAGAVAVERELGRPDVGVALFDDTSSTVGGVARGALELRLVNRGRDPVRVDLGFAVEGLRVLRGEPEPLPELPAGGEQEVRVVYLVPSCDALRLPGRLLVGAEVDGQARVEREVPVVDARLGRPAPGAVALSACPSRVAAGARPTDVAARPAGGGSRRLGAGAVGVARLEVRNGGPTVRLLSVDARVPGVQFTPRVLSGGLQLPQDGLAVVGLRFRVPDCSRLQHAGWLVLRVARSGGVQEIGLRITAEPAGGLGPQAPLPVVLEACDELSPRNN